MRVFVCVYAEKYVRFEGLWCLLCAITFQFVKLLGRTEIKKVIKICIGLNAGCNLIN